MDKYINVTKAIDLLEKMAKHTKGYFDSFFVGNFAAALRLVEFFPRVDVVEVKHGKWLVDEFQQQDKKYITCSVCNSVIDCVDMRVNENEFDFCPYCGAKMDINGGQNNG